MDDSTALLTNGAMPPQAIAVIHEGNHLSVNSAYVKLFGFRRRTDLTGVPLFEMVVRSDQSKLKNALRVATRDNATQSLQLKGLRSDGSAFLLRLLCIPMEVSDEPCLRIVARAEDFEHQESAVAAEQEALASDPLKAKEPDGVTADDGGKPLEDQNMGDQTVEIDLHDQTNPMPAFSKPDVALNGAPIAAEGSGQRAGIRGLLALILTNHVLANLAFIIALAMGIVSYFSLPREQDPSINFNWIDITTLWPGASAQDVSKRVTEVLEDAVADLEDVRFISSTSRDGASSIVVRFRNLDQQLFDQRIDHLYREIQNQQDQLPAAAETPDIFVATSSNRLPSAIVVVTAAADDEILRRQSELVLEDLERLSGVHKVIDIGLHDPELQVLFDPHRLESLNVDPSALANSVTSYYRDVSAGTLQVGSDTWLVRLQGTDSDPERLAQLPVTTAQGEIPLSALAQVQRGRQKPQELLRYEGQPGVMLAVTKQANANQLELVAKLKAYIEERNRLTEQLGVRLVLADDQTPLTRSAIEIMRNNLLVGLGLVLLVTVLFLGKSLALLTCLGIAFTLSVTFWLLALIGQTLNVTVLLGIVIAMGMLVDDTVVVAEAIFHRLERGMDALRASLDALREVFAPVTTSVLTTIAAFTPLMLIPGVIGDFMRVVPITVVAALAISLVEAYWMLPAHVIGAGLNFDRPSVTQRWRMRLLRALRRRYTQMLVRVLRYPLLIFGGMGLAVVMAALIVMSGQLKFDFFATTPQRIFYINLVMPSEVTLEKSLAIARDVEAKAAELLTAEERRALISFAGFTITDTGPLYGDHFAQVFVSLMPEGRDVDTLIAQLRGELQEVIGPREITFRRLTNGPPTASPISIKMRSESILELRAAVEALKGAMARQPGIIDIRDDDVPGRRELRLQIDRDVVQRAGLDPDLVAQTIALLVDGQVVARFQDAGEPLDVRVRAYPRALNNLDELLRTTLPLPDGGRIPLVELVERQVTLAEGQVRRYNFRRTITVEANIDSAVTNTLAANRQVSEAWRQVSANYPNVTLEYSGELADVQESLDAIGLSFLFGLGLIYLILGTQFRSYRQPLLILMTIPTAGTGVILGLWLGGQPLSLYSLYGAVALAGVVVNGAIVYIAAANARRERGLSKLRAAIFAARRRVAPILITSLTTMAGLFSLATGLAGRSEIWEPVATAIVWGLGFATFIILFALPPLYYYLSASRHPTHV